MTLEQAQQLAKTLAKKFKVSTPTVQFKPRRNGYPASCSDYIFLTETIRLASWDITANTILHEFAHHLCKIQGYYAHRKDFFFTLILIIDFYYAGDLIKYNWKHEYIILQKYYAKYFCK